MGFPCWLLGQQGAGDNFFHLTIDNGLPTNSVYDILQDDRGFIWLATHSGLVKYDGFNFRNFTVKNGIPRNDIRKIFYDSRGDIWILAHENLSVYHNGAFIDKSNENVVGGLRMLSILEDHKGKIWLTSAPFVVSISRTSGDEQVYKVEDEPIGIFNSSILEQVDQEGNIWVYGNAGFSVLDTSGEYSRREIDFSMENILNPATFLRKSGEIIFSSAEGLAEIDAEGNQKLIFTDFKGVFHPEEISYILGDVSGDLWVGSDSNGAVRLSWKNGTWQLDEEILPGNSITRIFQDHEQNLWFCTSGNGVFMLSFNANEIRKENSEFMNNLGMKIVPARVNDVYSTGRELWLAKDDGQIIWMDLEKDHTVPTIYDLKDQLREDEELQSVIKLASGRILVATGQRLAWVENGKMVEINGFDDNNNLEEPVSIFQGKSGDIIVGTNSLGNLWCSEDDLLTLTNTTETGPVIDKIHEKYPLILNGPSYATALDEGNRLWLAWAKGVSRIKGDQDLKMFEKDNVFKARVNDIQPSDDSLVWIATNGSGLIVAREDDHHVLGREQGLKSEVCNAVFVEKGTKTVWVATNSGLGRISNYDFLSRNFPIQWFDEKDGLVSRNISSVSKAGDKLFVCSKNGVTVLNESRINMDTIPPPVYITAFKTEGNDKNKYDPEQPDKIFIVTPDSNAILISFIGISFRNPGKLMFEYRLREAKSPWQKTDQTSISYQALKPGDYTFQVRAITRDGVHSRQLAEVTFEVRPAFYEAWWFWTMLVLIFLFSLFMLVRYLYAERQKLQLEMKVEQKTVELRRKVEELHRTNQDLEQFAYIASHDLKTPLRTVIGHLQLLERKFSDVLEEEALEYLNFAVNGARRMYNMINDLLDYARVGRDRMNFEQIDLNEILESVRKSLQNLIAEEGVIIEAAPLPVIVGIRTQWELLLQNLIENGIKFNESEQPRIQIDYKDSPEFWIFSVQDNGIGINEEYQSRIFDLFQRLQAGDVPGTGIGLAICKRIVEVHGGNIWTESEEGEGTTFFFTIEKKNESVPEPLTQPQ